jgi:hypothetical protein
MTLPRHGFSHPTGTITWLAWSHLRWILGPGSPPASACHASCVALTIGLLLIAVISHAGDRSPDLGTPTGQTPYDRFFGPLRRVMADLGENHPTLSEVNDLVREGRGFRYSHIEPYVPQMPEVTERLHAGDCKDKSLWLASRMDDASLRFVVGKLTRGARKSHAWLLWRDQGNWFILDATMQSSAVALERASENDWVPLFSYSAHGKFRHPGAGSSTDWMLPEPIGRFPSRHQMAALPDRQFLDFQRARSHP